LLAARVLADTFDHVTIFDRDSFPQSPKGRPGTPQSAHGHILLVGGVRAIVDLFPGIKEQLIEAGAIPGDACRDAIVNVRGRRLPRFSSDLKGLLLSRNLLEWQVRRRVAALGNVTFRERSRVTGFLYDEAGSRVSGVSISGPENRPQEIHSDLVVDTSGQRSVASHWLRDRQIKVPELVVDAHVGYASRRFERPAVWKEDWKVAAISWFPPKNRCAGGIYPEENGIWIASLVGALDGRPSTDENGFLEHVRKLEDSALLEHIRQSKPVSNIVGYRMQGSRKRSFSNLSRKLDGLLVLGDALCTVNPFYGQGMTIAALQAQKIKQELAGRNLRDRQSLQRAIRSAQKACERMLTVPWLFSTTEDLRHGHRVDGRRTILHRITSWYVDRAIRVQSQRTITALYRTMGMVDNYALLRLPVLLDVLTKPVSIRLKTLFNKGRQRESTAAGAHND